ncbi:MAG: GntR family transcriptional regulator [Tissierellia bacterium]|nr:GntR family transcriptional regulator [Tissierellia bacterium]
MTSPVQKVYKTIRERILNQEYVPSQTLVESSLAEEFGVSRNTVRKALMQLVNDKLVVMEANKSAMVKYLTREEAINLMEIRERLEGLITYSAAENISQEDLDKIKLNLEMMKKSLEEGDIIEYSERNDIIHKIIDDACANRQAIELIESIRIQLRSYNKRTILLTGRSEESYQEHLELFKALEARDREKSELLMRKHMANVRETLIKNYNMLF